MTGNVTVHTAVACTNDGSYDVIMDCREDGGIINIMWTDNITFFAQKNSAAYPDCELQDDSCTAHVTGTSMEGRLETFCNGQVRCTVEMEQTWVPAVCGADGLNYMEVTYMCIQPGTHFPFCYTLSHQVWIDTLLQSRSSITNVLPHSGLDRHIITEPK